MIVLVLGGTRSGKSGVAESLASDLSAQQSDAVTYIATARPDPDDADHRARIDAHRRRRPAAWRTEECPVAADLSGVLRRLEGTVLVDSLGTWVTGDPDLSPDVVDLLDALSHRTGTTILVSEEVGMAPHAPTALGRRFADALGEINTAVSARADRALLVVAGRVLELPPPGEHPC